MTILAIETSCDETAVAISQDDRLIKNLTYSQVKHHTRYGGVHPSIARRAHTERLPLLAEDLLKKTHTKLPTCNQPSCNFCQSQPSNLTTHHSITALAVTVGPGLPPALEAGVKFAKKLALEHHLPLIPVNHLEGHIASLFTKRSTGTYFTKKIKNINTPFLNLIVSGGHTELVITSPALVDKTGTLSKPVLSSRTDLVQGKHQTDTGSRLVIKHYLLSQTLDDAAGEVIDKIGRELGLGYPAGPVLEDFAKHGNPNAYDLPTAMINSAKENLDFSFSGLKTKALQTLHGRHDIGSATQRPNLSLSKNNIHNFAAAFQEAVIDSIILKVNRAMDITKLEHVTLSGGVAANNRLRRRLGHAVREKDGTFYACHKNFTGDNAAMIATAACWAHTRGQTRTTPEEIKAIDRLPNLNFPNIIQ